MKERSTNVNGRDNGIDFSLVLFKLLILSFRSKAGGVATLLAVIFLTIGFFFNAAAIGTCRLVAIDGFRDPDDGQLVRATGLGLYTIEGTDLSPYCYFLEYNDLTSSFAYWTDSDMTTAR